MAQTFGALLTDLDIPFIENALMATRTTLRVGGPAEYLVEARSASEVSVILRAAGTMGVPALIIGNGSNLLVPDEGIRGLVLVIGNGMASIAIENNRIHAQAGALLGSVAVAAQAAGLSGLEALSGIPGTIGGAACMNAGAYGAEMAGLTLLVEALDMAGEPHTLEGDSLGFGYRTSALSQRGLVAVGVELALTPGDSEEIAAAMRNYARQRREKQPIACPSAGSFFKRPEGHFAGALIERAGMKGVSVGGAQVSEMHAGFLINTGDAKARDFFDLMALVKDRVYEDSGIMLEPEVRIIGCGSSY